MTRAWRSCEPWRARARGCSAPRPTSRFCSRTSAGAPAARRRAVVREGGGCERGHGNPHSPSESTMNVTTAPSQFHVLTKPTGAICNLDCKYCFFLSKEELYPNSRFRMTDELLERYIRQQLDSQSGPEATISWQGGEPTLMGLDFFRRSVELADTYRRSGQSVQYTIQTNGTLLDEEWCRFLHENKYLVGLSLDGPRELHDVYRVDKGGHPTFDKVLRAARLMQQHQADFNVLCTVHAKNAGHPLEVYRFFRDDLQTRHIQLIPIVERVNSDGRTRFQEGNEVTDRSVTAEQWG